MSETTWQKRATISLPCPSGAVCQVRRPSPEISLKAGRLTHVFSPAADAQQVVEELSDDEAAKVYLFARQLVMACVVSPVLTSDQSGGEGLTPEDIPPTDFWFVFSWAMRGGHGLPVATKEGETTVEAVETFPDESGALHIPSGDGEQVSQVSV